MTNKFFQKLTAFFLGAMITFNTASVTLTAIANESFYGEDSLRNKIIASATGETDKTIFQSKKYHSSTGAVRYIVGFNDTAKSNLIKRTLSGYNYRLLADSKEKIFLISFSSEEERLLFQKENASILDFLEKDEKKELSAFYPDDTYANSYELELLKMQTVWDYGFGKENIIVAIADSGVDRFHEDLAGANILPGYDYEKGQSNVDTDFTGHGTKVTGIIAADNNNGTGCSGIAPGCTVLPLKITDSTGRIYTSDFIDALYLAADSGAHIINMSLGSYEKLESEEKAVAYAVKKGCILIAAAGNEGNDANYAGMKCYPASYDGVISVGAIDEMGKSCVFSQHNDAVDISAPGSGLSLLQSGGGYTTDSGTSFSSAYISGIAALALSQLDEGIKINSDQFDHLISQYAYGDSGRETGAGTIYPPDVVKNVNFPLVSGVENGKVYYDNVSISFNRGTALLDGEPFENGGLCKHTGEHILTVTEGENSVTVGFITDNIPLSYSLKEGDGYAYISYQYGKATLNGMPYSSGDKITSEGKHILELTGPYGNVSTFDINLSFAKPTINGVSDGGIYSHPVRINVATGGKIYLNGKEANKEFTVFEEGNHTLLIKQNGGLTTSLNFIISYDIYDEGETENKYAYTLSDTSMTEAKVIFTDGFLIAYNNVNRGIRIFDSETSKLVRYINVGENVKSVSVGTSKIYVCGTNHIFALDRNSLDSASQIETLHQTEFPVSASEFFGDVLYCAESSSISLGTIKKISFENLSDITETPICTIRSIPDVLSYDRLTDSVAFGIKETGLIYVSPVSGGTMKMLSFPEESTKNGFVFRNGKIASGGKVSDVETEKTLFAFNGKKPLYFDGTILITEKCSYNTETFETLGFHSMEFTSVSFNEDRYCISFGDTSLYVSKGLPSALCRETAVSKGDTLGFTEHLNLSSTFTHVLKQNDRIYATGEDNALYVLTENLEYISFFDLPFSPTGIESDGEKIYIYSDKTSFFAVYDQKGMSYISAPCNVSKLSASKEYICIIGKNATQTNGLYLCDKNGTVIFEDYEEDYVSAVLSDDGKSLYAIRSKSFYTALSAFSVPDFIPEYERILEYSADDVFCDSTYLYINTAAYLTRNGSIFASCAARIYGRTYDTLVTSKGLFKNGEFISRHNADSPLYIFSEKGSLYLFGEEYAQVTHNVYGGDLGAEPQIDGIENGAFYSGEVTPIFNIGKAFLDGTPIENGTAISGGGEHVFCLLLPFGVKKEITFTVNASLAGIKIKGGDRAIKTNDSISLSVEFLPTGAPTEQIMFYAETDVLKVTTDGVVTGLKTGEASVYAATLDGRFFTSIKVSVLSSILIFTPAYMGIDRTNNVLHGIPSGMTVSSLINALEPSLRKDAVVYEGEAEASGIVKTGMKISLLSKQGEVLDSLAISVIGDCNGDGDVDVGDLARATELLGGETVSAEFIKSADFSNTGTVDVADLFTYKDIILGNEKIISSANTVKPPYSGSVSFECIHLTDGTVKVTLKASGEKEFISGFSGIIKYDKSKLDFLSSDKAGYVHGAQDNDGEIKFLIAYKPESHTEIQKPNEAEISFTFLPLAEENTLVTANNLIIYSSELSQTGKESSKKADNLQIIVNKPYEEEDLLPSLLPSTGTLIPEFSPDVFSYALRIPYGTTSIEFTADGKPLQYVLTNKNGNVSDILEDNSVITVFYGNEKYKITVIMDTITVDTNKTLWIVVTIIICTVVSGFSIFLIIHKRLKNANAITADTSSEKQNNQK